MSISQQQVVDCARSYLDTPFSHAGRSKGKAMDCVGLPLMIAGDLGVLDTSGLPIHGNMYTAYTPQPVNNIVLDLCRKHLVRVAVPNKQPGDVLVIRIFGSTQGTPCHVGIYTGVVNGRPNILHAYTGVGRVCEHPIDPKWERFIVAAFRFPGVE